VTVLICMNGVAVFKAAYCKIISKVSCLVNIILAWYIRKKFPAKVP